MDPGARVARFSEEGRPVSYLPGEVIFHEGANGGYCVAVVDGEMLITTSSTTGSTIVLGRRGPGDLVGQLALLDDGPRSARVVATTNVSARKLTSPELEQLLAAHPDMALAEIRRLAAEVRSLSRRITGRSDELRVRVLDLLELQAETTGERVFRSTREELAGWVGASREAVARTLSDLAADGIVALGRGEVRLLG